MTDVTGVLNAGTKVLPCRFCGGAGFTSSPSLGRSFWTVVCDDCCAEGPHGGKGDAGEAKAIAAWNRLATGNERAEVVHLRAALQSAIGYMMNARIDLETGTKTAGIATISGGIKRDRAALDTPPNG